MTFEPAVALDASTASRKLQSALHAPSFESVVLVTVNVVVGARGTTAGSVCPALNTIKSRSPFIFRGIASTATGALGTSNNSGNRVDVVTDAPDVGLTNTSTCRLTASSNKRSSALRAETFEVVSSDCGASAAGGAICTSS